MIQVVAELDGVFEVFKGELPRVCAFCLDGVAEFPWGFECGCGAAFALDIVCVSDGRIVVAPAHPEPCFEPEPEAEAT